MARSPAEIGRSNVRRSKTHERRIAELLTNWSGLKFRRRRNEGRDFQTIAVESTSDVIPVGFDIHFTIEAKCGAGLSLDALLANPQTAILTKWYHQSSYDAELLTKIKNRPIYPLLFIKPSKNFDWVVFPAKAMGHLRFSESSIAALGSRISNSFTVQSTTSYTLPWFPHLLFDAYTWSGQISCNISHTKNKKNKVMYPIQLEPIIMCRWKDFADNIDPKSIVV